MTKKNKEELDSEINKLPFKTIIKKNGKGEIKQVMDKPKLKQIDKKIHVSGCHMFTDKPEENHYDHYEDGKEWKEKQTKDKKLKFPYKVDKEKVLV